jgi:hypothetical protein
MTIDVQAIVHRKAACTEKYLRYRDYREKERILPTAARIGE